MCGFTGFLDPSGQITTEAMQALVVSMSDQIRHRGPDDEGSWVDPEAGLALGFRRLAILDLSESGNQPMFSANGRYVIVFNGENYNFQNLKRELDITGYPFKGTSDTEVILAAVQSWGLKKTLTKLNGMYAFALWDRAEKHLHLVRDHFGIKPLYYGWAGKTLLFGSELKPFLRHPKFEGRINQNALTLYLRDNCIPYPYTIYEGIKKLPPGSLISFGLNELVKEPDVQTYWSLKQVAQEGIRNSFTGSDEAAVAELDSILRDSLKDRMIADVPLGAFLSGGVDSSTVTAIMQQLSARPIKTFSIGFSEENYNEARYAKSVAAHLGTDHTELIVSAKEAQSVIPVLPQMYDEPFSDSSAIPTYLVSRLARQDVTVSLSGDGGDELFGGYNRYLWVPKIWKNLKWIPEILRRMMSGSMGLLSPGFWSSLQQPMGLSNIPQFPDKIQKIQRALLMKSPEDIYYDLSSHRWDYESVVLNGTIPLTFAMDEHQWPEFSDSVNWMMYIDQMTYMINDILTKMDRASMAVSLEARVPLLDDRRVVELAWRLPKHMKIRDGVGKWILRQVLYQYVPRELIERPKMGFGIPLDTWLRGPLREWGQELLSERRLREEGFFDPKAVLKKWNEHQNGSYNWQHELWDVLMFQAWKK
ncbi:MAG: asparagine synthase (glutamine-hydrolyzing) [Anaerolineaceae bacterium]|nr:asparagine synthase (glutamine-hydrolyzing) [Anaerolineaceae bacterium]